MAKKAPSRLAVTLDGLHRWRWWIWAVLGGALAFLAGSGDGGSTADVVLGLLLILVWLPSLVRGGIIACQAFREGFQEG